MNKIRLPKLTMAQLMQAAKGEFDVDVTDDILKAMGMDNEARTMGLLTKGVGDSNTAETLANLKAAVDAIIAKLDANNTANTQTLTAIAEPLRADGDVLKAIDSIRAEMAGVKAEVTKALEQVAQATATAEAVKAELSGKGAAAIPGATTGAIPADMMEFLRNQKEAFEGAKAGGSQFPFDSVGEL